MYDLADELTLDSREARDLRSSWSLSRNERSWTRLEKDMVGISEGENGVPAGQPSVEVEL